MAYSSRSKAHHYGSYRPYSCSACGHKLRFGASNCGRCYEPTGLLNRRWIWATLGCFALTAFMIVVAVIVYVVMTMGGA